MTRSWTLPPAGGVLCSRTCARCGAKVGRIGGQFCGQYSRRERRAQAQQPCPRCGKPGRIRGDTGWCRPCSRPGRPRAPDAACSACGTITRLAGAGLCPRCYDKSAHRVAVRAGNLAASLDARPAWLPGFAGYLAPRHHATRACQMIILLGRLLRDGGPVHPQDLLERAPSLSIPLARALEDFFTRHHLALPPDHEEHAAARRRQRRLQAIPAPLRAAAEAFAEHELNGRQRALLAGTRPRQHATIEAHLTAICDLVRFLAATTAITDWATVDSRDVQAFLAAQPSRAAHRLSALRRFFSFAARRRLTPRRLRYSARKVKCVALPQPRRRPSWRLHRHHRHRHHHPHPAHRPEGQAPPRPQRTPPVPAADPKAAGHGHHQHRSSPRLERQ